MATIARDHSPAPLSARTATRPQTVFVFSGGASLGALQVGMLQALDESGIVPDLLLGTSAGALNAAFIASRPQTRATARALGRVWRGVQREDVFPLSMSALVGGLCGRRDHVVPDRRLRRRKPANSREVISKSDHPIPTSRCGPGLRLKNGQRSPAVNSPLRSKANTC